MAGEASSEQIRDIMAELSEFAELGQQRWQFSGGPPLITIEGLWGIRKKVSDNAASRPSIVADAIETACKAVPDKWRDAALAHLGYAGYGSKAKGSREAIAAKSIGWSPRTYQATQSEGRHKGRIYGEDLFQSWADVTLYLAPIRQ